MYGLRVLLTALVTASGVFSADHEEHSITVTQESIVVSDVDVTAIPESVTDYDDYKDLESISPAPLVITASPAVLPEPASSLAIDINLSISLEIAANETEEVSKTLMLPTMVIPSLGNAAASNVTEESFEGDSVFLSFEEWRKQNLELSGQSTNDLDERAVHRHPVEQPQLNVIGEDNEIDLAMFQAHPDQVQEDENRGKVYKKRFNFASFDCAATIVKTNTGTKGASNILFENKDTYLINECSEPNKFVIIELCQDILVDTVKIANFEFFSSMFRHVRISVTDTFPSSSWRVLGEFEAKSVRDFQSFSIKNPQIWARFLRIEFLSHYGNEFYCPISVVQVHGTTMMDEYRSHEQSVAHTGDKKPVAVPSGHVVVTPVVPVPGTIQSSVSENQRPFVESKPTDDFKVPEIPTSKFGAPPRESSTECIEPTNQQEDAEFSPENMSLPLMGEVILPLVLNESCKWDEYLYTTQASMPNKTNSEIVAEPKTQDSIYQTIMKRLSLLESNATLSLRYIEDQSQNLRELLHKIEKKQNNRIESFFNEFNSTVISQFQTFQEQYSKLLITTILDAKTHQQRVNQDIEAMSYRLKLLTDELVYQKNMGIIQAIVLLTILIFVIITRGAPVDSHMASQNLSRLFRMGSVTNSVVGSPRSLWARSPNSSPLHSGDEDFSPIETSFASGSTPAKTHSLPAELDRAERDEETEEEHEGDDRFDVDYYEYDRDHGNKHREVNSDKHREVSNGSNINPKVTASTKLGTKDSPIDVFL